MTVLARAQRWATALWLALAGGAGLGFLARDVLALGAPGVAAAWVCGALLAIAGARRRRR